MGDYKGCLVSLGFFALGILGLIFIKEILVGWWIFLAICLIIAVAIALFGK